MTRSLVEAFELVNSANQVGRRLDGVAAELAKLPGLKDEKTWMAIACKKVAASAQPIKADLLLRALRLPDLDPIRDEQAKIYQGFVVDALERVHAAITFAGTARSPLLEALYYKLKIPVLRKCDPTELDTFWKDFQARLQATYPKRMLEGEQYAVVLPALDELRSAMTTWWSVFSPEPIPEAEANAIREELAAAARPLEITFRQARLLAHAALVPVKELLDLSGIVPKGKRRLRPGEHEDGEHPALDRDPPDPSLPTPEEAEELETVHERD